MHNFDIPLGSVEDKKTKELEVTEYTVAYCLNDYCMKYAPYGYIKNDNVYVIKIASGFFNNSNLGLPNGYGMMLIYDQKTGKPKAILNDESFLTDVRTAVAGAISAKYLAPSKVTHIGIFGSGIQARRQLNILDGFMFG